MTKKIKKSKTLKKYAKYPEIAAVYYLEDHTMYMNEAYIGEAGCPIILIKPDKTEEEN